MMAEFPRRSRKDLDSSAEAEMGLLMGVITAIRNIRGEMRISPSVSLRAILRPATRADAERLSGHAPLVQALAKAEVTVDSRAARPRASAMALIGTLECFVPLEGFVDLQAERQRLEKEIGKADDDIRFLERKLSKVEFRERAPAEIVEREEQRLNEQRRIRVKLEESLRWVDAPDVR